MLEVVRNVNARQTCALAEILQELIGGLLRVLSKWRSIDPLAHVSNDSHQIGHAVKWHS
jgi:hypothetical protein